MADGEKLGLCCESSRFALVGRGGYAFSASILRSCGEAEVRLAIECRSSGEHEGNTRWRCSSELNMPSRKCQKPNPYPKPTSPSPRYLLWEHRYTNYHPKHHHRYASEPSETKPSKFRPPPSSSRSKVLRSFQSVMPPKTIRGTAVGRPAPQRGGYARQVVNELTSPENRSVVTSLAFFAVSHSRTERRRPGDILLSRSA